MKFTNKSIYGIVLSLLISTNLVADCSYELFTISSTKNTRIIDFIEKLSDDCDFSILVSDPNAEKYLNGALNKTHLKNLTIDEVLDIVLKENNLAYTLENNLLKISYLQTKVFSMDYILSTRKGIGTTDITLSSSSTDTSGDSTSTDSSSSSGSGANAESGMKIETTDEVKFWEELDLELQRVLNRPEDTYVSEAPIINRNAGLITVTSTQKQINRLEKYLQSLQDKVQLQVLIDVHLLSVTMSKGRTTGVDWKQLYALQNINLKFDYSNSNSGQTESTAFSAGIDASLDEVIKFLQTQGDVNSISNPKVLTLNNQPALITAGTEYFYKTTSTETLASGTSGTQSANETIQSVFAGVLLDITPEISDDKTITLKINPSLSQTREDMSTTSGEDRTMPPDLNRRQLSSVVTIKDGNRVILGGLINTTNDIESNKVPILGDIPGLSYLFKYESRTKVVEELVIVIEPHIVHKNNPDLSLSDLGYQGFSDELLQKNKHSISHTSDRILKEDNLASDKNK